MYVMGLKLNKIIYSAVAAFLLLCLFTLRDEEVQPDVGSEISTKVSRQQKRNAQMSKYDKKAQSKVGIVMKEYKEGTLKSGKTGKKVTSRKQAIAIGLSEARKRGYKVPPTKKSE
jgi:hypothetical protein